MQFTYGFHSCILEGIGYIIPRLVVGVIVEVLCSYITLPLYAIVTQMGDSYKQAIFAQHMQATLHGWVEEVRKRKRSHSSFPSTIMGVFGRKKKKEEASTRSELQMHRLVICKAFEDPQETGKASSIAEISKTELEDPQILAV
ncbi:hypothetical protein HPP92_027031 [Vanilla planifolia]|uniref:MLO-like protein n=1 Tax=Vanilla planifolia TaxID=51239 RepID=A0A835U5C5_VANPL|nr:hypothetical protein HPP92_027031 [Vanilla planifolia]